MLQYDLKGQQINEYYNMSNMYVKYIHYTYIERIATIKSLSTFRFTQDFVKQK